MSIILLVTSIDFGSARIDFRAIGGWYTLQQIRLSDRALQTDTLPVGFVPKSMSSEMVNVF